MGKERTKRKSRKKEKVERERERSFEEEKVPTSHPMVRITIQKIRNKSRANSSRQLYEFINLVWGFVYSFSSFPHVQSHVRHRCPPICYTLFDETLGKIYIHGCECKHMFCNYENMLIIICVDKPNTASPTNTYGLSDIKEVLEC